MHLYINVCMCIYIYVAKVDSTASRHERLRVYQLMSVVKGNMGEKSWRYEDRLGNRKVLKGKR